MKSIQDIAVEESPKTRHIDMSWWGISMVLEGLMHLERGETETETERLTNIISPINMQTTRIKHVCSTL